MTALMFSKNLRGLKIRGVSMPSDFFFLQAPFRPVWPGRVALRLETVVALLVVVSVGLQGHRQYHSAG